MSRQLTEEDLRRIARAIRTALEVAQEPVEDDDDVGDGFFLWAEVEEATVLGSFTVHVYDEELLLIGDALEALLTSTRMAADRLAGWRDPDGLATAAGKRASELWELASNALSDRFGPWTATRMLNTAAGTVIRWGDCQAAA